MAGKATYFPVTPHTEANDHRNLFATVTYYPSPDLDKSLQNIMMDEIQAVKSVPGFFPNLIFQPLYEAAIQAGKEGGGNAAGIDADGPLTGMSELLLQELALLLTALVVLLTALWEKSEDDEAINSFVSRWTERATSASKDAHKHHPWLYINYASKEQDPFSGYGEDNLRRLRSIQKSVDPEGILTSTGLCKGYFKLF